MRILSINSFDLNLPYFEVSIDNKTLRVITIFLDISEYKIKYDYQKHIEILSKRILKFKNREEIYFIYNKGNSSNTDENLEYDLKLQKCILLSNLEDLSPIEQYFIDKELFNFIKDNIHTIDVYISGFQVYFSLLSDITKIKEKDIAENMMQLHTYYNNINNLPVLLNLDKFSEDYYNFASKIIKNLKELSPFINYRKIIRSEALENKEIDQYLSKINNTDTLVKALYNYENIGYLSQISDIIQFLQEYNALDELVDFISLGYDFIKKMIKTKKILLFNKIRSNFFNNLENYTNNEIRKLDIYSEEALEIFSFEKFFLYLFIKYFYSYSYIDVPINIEKLNEGNLLDYALFFNYVNFILKSKSREELKENFKNVFIREYYVRYNDKFFIDRNLKVISEKEIVDFIDKNFDLSEYKIFSLFLNIYPYVLDRKIALDYFETIHIEINEGVIYPKFFITFFSKKNPFTKKSKFFEFSFTYKDIILVSSCNVIKQNAFNISSDEFLNRIYISGNLVELYSYFYLKNMLRKFEFLKLNTIQTKALENFLSQFNIIPSKYNYGLYITGNFYSSLYKNYYFLLNFYYKSFYDFKYNLKSLPIISFDRELLKKKIGKSVLALIGVESPFLLKSVRNFLTELESRTIIEIELYNRSLTSLLNLFLNFDKESTDISDLILFIDEKIFNENRDIPFVLRNFKDNINKNINIYIFLFLEKDALKNLISDLYFFKDKMKRKKFFIVPVEVRNGRTISRS